MGLVPAAPFPASVSHGHRPAPSPESVHCIIFEAPLATGGRFRSEAKLAGKNGQWGCPDPLTPDPLFPLTWCIIKNINKFTSLTTSTYNAPPSRVCFCSFWLMSSSFVASRLHYSGPALSGSFLVLVLKGSQTAPTMLMSLKNPVNMSHRRTLQMHILKDQSL